MYNPDTIQTDFVINLDSAAKWLKTRKSDLHETLKQSYKIDLDYTVTGS
jgi:hypothetical protein